MGNTIDVDEFKVHTANLIKLAKEANDKDSEVFFSGVIDYVDKYVEVFHKGDN